MASATVATPAFMVPMASVAAPAVRRPRAAAVEQAAAGGGAARWAAARRRPAGVGDAEDERAQHDKARRRKREGRPAVGGGGGRLRDPFQVYMDEISRGDVLDHSSVIALADRIRRGVVMEQAQAEMERESGGRRPTVVAVAERLGMGVAEVQRTLNLGMVAKNDLVAANLRLVTSVARKVQASKAGSAGLALDDMIQEGNVGLIRAAEKYDATKGYRFSTYATWWVRASVLRAITTQSRAIKLPSSVVEDHARIEKERARQISAGALVPDDDAVAVAVGMTRAKLKFVTGVVTRLTASLDVPLGTVDSSLGAKSLGELIPGDEDIEERMVETMQRRELDTVLRAKLKPMERAAVRLRFGLEDGHPRTLLEVGQLLAISKERVRQLVFSALAKLKTPEFRERLEDYLA